MQAWAKREQAWASVSNREQAWARPVRYILRPIRYILRPVREHYGPYGNIKSVSKAWASVSKREQSVSKAWASVSNLISWASLYINVQDIFLVGVSSVIDQTSELEFRLGLVSWYHAPIIRSSATSRKGKGGTCSTSTASNVTYHSCAGDLVLCTHACIQIWGTMYEQE